MRIAVAGGTGLMGRLVVAELAVGGHEPVVLARSAGVDLTTDVPSLEGCGAVIDVSNVVTTRAPVAEEFFTKVTENLLATGVPHLVALSIVGVDRVPLGYYRGKLRQEARVQAGPLPWTVLRATQFHEFAEQTFGRFRGPLMPVPRMLTQPVSAREVAARLVRLATGEAQGFAREMAGPEQLELVDMCRRLLRTQGRRRVVLPIPLPVRGLASGGLLPAGEYVRGVQTFDQYLEGL